MTGKTVKTYYQGRERTCIVLKRADKKSARSEHDYWWLECKDSDIDEYHWRFIKPEYKLEVIEEQKPDKENLQDIQEKITNLHCEIHIILDKHLGEDEGQWHTVGEWDCEKSPVGLCVYHFIEDPAKDNCIFCGNPQERK